MDTENGIRFRGFSLPDCQELLPKAVGGNEPLPEALFWLLLTGKIPTSDQIDQLRAELTVRSKLPEYVADAINALPTDLHPVSQFSIGILAMQKQIQMAVEYEEGAHKSTFWEHCYESVLTIHVKENSL